MSSKRDRYGNPLYGSVHKAERKRWALRVNAGEVCCWRCGNPIPAGSKWDLGHVDDEGRMRGFPYRHPEHIGCNRAEPFRKLHRQANEFQANGYREPEPWDRFDGLPDPTPTNRAERWSRHWDVGRFNPRCRDCRKRGSMCDFALESARRNGRAA
jgi:hypothetical protein